MGRPRKEVSEQNIEKFQRELELAGNRSDLLLQDKKGRSRSCLLCKRRKQKCDHKLPSCTACLKASVKCIQPARYSEDIMVTTNSANNIKNEETPTPAPTPIPTSNNIPNNTNTNNTNDTTNNSKNSSNINNNDIYVDTNVGTTANTQIPLMTTMTPPVSIATTPGSISGINLNLLSVAAEESNTLSKTNGKNNNNNSNSSNNNNNNNNKVQKPKNSTTSKQDKDQYTAFLERKLRYLEKMIDLPIGGAVFTKKLRQYKNITHLLGEIDDLENCVPQMNNENSNSGMNAFSSTISDKEHQLPIATSNATKTISIRRFNDTNSKIPALASDSLDSIDFNKCIFARYFSKKYLPYDPAFEFDRELARLFLDTYFTRLQFKYPLLDEQEIYTFYEHYAKNNIYSYSTNEFHFASGRMWLVFSISSYMQMTTGKYKGLTPDRYFSTAVRHITKCGDKLNYVQRVELLTLLVLYLIRTDRDSLVLYEVIKDIMFICKENLSLNQWFPQDPFAHKKLRLFWCVYLLERMICVAVGKPFTVSESEISLPLFDEDSFNTEGKEVKSVHFINQSLRLRRIESSFVEKLDILPDADDNNAINPLNIPRNSQLSLVNDFFKQLEVWRASCSTTHVKNFENETLKLYYYRAVRLLIQPYLEFLTPEDRLFRECQAAAGQICQLYKIFHQKTITGHSSPAVHTVFVAGVTLVYCMWLARNYDDERRKKLGDDSKHTRPLVSASLFSNMDDLRACSVCLYVMTERSKFARVFRDTFDELMNATIGNLIERCGPDSSELIYLSNFKYSINSDPLKLNSTSTFPNNATSMENGLSSSSDNDDSQTKNGMPPARKRIFGKGQAEEHAGFVEYSQVDIEEQKRLKKKQGDLEKESLPRGLAHLLVNKREEKNISNPEAVDTRQDNQRGKLDENEVPEQELEQDEEEDQNPKYIVKKPSNSNDFNWQTFQQQAFLQQQLAQQNLQAYLSSLNFTPQKRTVALSNTMTNNNNGNLNPAAVLNHIQQEVQDQVSVAMNSTSQHANEPVNLNQRSDKGMTQPHLTNDHVVSDIATSTQNLYGINNKNNNNNNIGMIPNLQNHRLSQVSNVSSSTASPLPMLHQSKANNGMFFDNGTHEMINNISTWTSNSVFDGIPIPPSHQNDAHPVGMTGPTINYSSEPNTMGAIQHHFSAVNKQHVHHLSHTPHQQLHEHHQNQQQLDQNGHLLQDSGALNAVHEESNGASLDSNIAHSSGRRGPTRGREFEQIVPATQVEEFWTINDDYGFLT